MSSISWQGRRGNSSRSSEGRVLGPRIGSLQRTVVQWLSADSGAASAFPRMLGADGFQMLSGPSDAPTLTTQCRCPTATELRKREPKRTQTQSTIARLERTPGQTLLSPGSWVVGLYPSERVRLFKIIVGCLVVTGRAGGALETNQG